MWFGVKNNIVFKLSQGKLFLADSDIWALDLARGAGWDVVKFFGLETIPIFETQVDIYYFY